MSAVETANALDALVLGAGFGGLHMVHELRKAGLNVLGVEAGSDAGGAWYWNRYPGARCDVESLVYSYSFSPIIDAEWKWSERYAAQPEIQRYLSFVCDRLDLRKNYRFNTRIIKAHYNEGDSRWYFTAEDGTTTFSAKYFVSAAGPISAPIWPDISGRENYKGTLLHTAMWPANDSPNLEGKRVGVLGTGSSGTQLIPEVAKQAKELLVFIRTPNYYSPANNYPLTESHLAKWKEIKDRVRARLRTFEVVGSGDVFMEENMMSTRNFPGHHFSKKERLDIMKSRWSYGGTVMPRAFSDVMTNPEINQEISDFLKQKVSETVTDPVKAELLTPKGFAFGTKRICIGTQFYETFNRDNVRAIDVKSQPIERFTEKGVVVGDKEVELDAIICASGFDALTGALTKIDIRGIGNQSIANTWANGVHTYLGVGVPGFPNFFMIGGPGSPSVLVNVVMANEYQVEWITKLIGYIESAGFNRCDVHPESADDWSRTVKNAIKGTVLEGADSWYVGANVPGKKREILAYAGGIRNYISACDQVAQTNYAGFGFV